MSDARPYNDKFTLRSGVTTDGDDDGADGADADDDDINDDTMILISV
jgi:hypothetical protein